MSELIRLCAGADVPATEPLQVIIEGYPPLAVYRVDGSYYVTHDTCTHGNASLAEGYQDGEIIECPFHGGAFNIKTGEATEFPCVEALKTYAVVERDGDVLIQP